MAVSLDTPRQHYYSLNKHFCWKNIYSYRHCRHFQNWQMLDGVYTVLSLLLDWILAPAPKASKSSGHYYRWILPHICNQDCTCYWWKMHVISRPQLYPDKCQNRQFYTVQIYINFLVLPNHIQNNLLQYFVHCLFRTSLVPGLGQSIWLKQSDRSNRQSYSQLLSFINVTSSSSSSSSCLTWMLRTAFPIKPNGVCVDHIFGQTGTDPVPATHYFSQLLIYIYFFFQIKHSNKSM
jgi:hypothetical protein